MKYYSARHSMKVVDGMVFLDQRVFISESCREKMLEYIYRCHLNKVKIFKEQSRFYGGLV